MSLNSSNNKDVNILFYSSKCKTCQIFITLAQNNNVLKFFKLISIDNQELEFQKKGLTIVPTLILKNMNKQIEGKECIKWLDSIIKSKNNTSNINNNELIIPEINSNKSILSNQSNNNLNNSSQNQFYVPDTNIKKRSVLNNLPEPKTIIKNSSLMGNQTSIENEEKNSKVEIPQVKPINQLFGFLENEMIGFSDSYAYLLVDNPLPKSFLPPDKDLQIYTAPESDKLDRKKQEMMTQNMETLRENDKNSFKKIIDESHKNILNKNI